MERILIESESIIVTDQLNTFASPMEEIVTSQGWVISLILLS